MIFGRHILGQQTPIDDAAFHHGLEHREDVAVDLRFVGDQRSRGVQNSGIDLPARAGLQPVGARMEQNSVVAFVPVFEASPHVVFRGAGLEAHERVREIVFGEIVLRREVVRLGLAALPHQFGLRVALVHVMRDGAHVVEELAEQIPSAFALHHVAAEQQIARRLDGVFQQEALFSFEVGRSSGLHLPAWRGRSRLWWWRRTSAR